MVLLPTEPSRHAWCIGRRPESLTACMPSRRSRNALPGVQAAGRTTSKLQCRRAARRPRTGQQRFEMVVTVGWSPAVGQDLRLEGPPRWSCFGDVCGKVQRPAAPQPSAPKCRQARRHDDVVGSPAPCPKPYSTRGILKHDRQCPAAPIARHRRCPVARTAGRASGCEPSTTLFSSRPPSRAAIPRPCRQMPGRTATAAVQRHRAAWEGPQTATASGLSNLLLDNPNRVIQCI